MSLNHFADLESDFGDSAPTVAQTEARLAALGLIGASSEIAERTMQATNQRRVEVDCPKCSGRGYVIIGYSYPRKAECFGCHGKGKILRAANYEQAKAAREARKARKAKEELEAAAARITQWAEQYPAEFAWIAKHRGSFDFASAMESALNQWGRLTQGQLEAVQRCVAREQAREQERAAQASAPVAADALDVSGLKGYYAVPDGDTRLKLRVKHPGKDSRFHGWVFVDDGAAYGSQQKYGSQAPGGKYRGKVQEQLRAILADPYAAQVAYGKLTGVCGHCGRPLEDAESVARGIGPICAAKYGA